MFPCICIVFGENCVYCAFPLLNGYLKRLHRDHIAPLEGALAARGGDYDADGDGDDDDEESKGDGVTHPERTLRDDPKDGRRKEGRKAKERTTKTLQFAPQRRRAREEEEEDEEDTNADFVVAYQ